MTQALWISQAITRAGRTKHAQIGQPQGLLMPHAYERGPTIALVVNEPGEFNELLEFATLVSAERAASCFFIFVRPDYAVIERHGQVCRARGFRYAHADSNYDARGIPFALNASVTDDYRPTGLSWAHPLKDAETWWREFSRSTAYRQPAERLPFMGRAALTLIAAVNRLGRLTPNWFLKTITRQLAETRAHWHRLIALERYGLAVLDYADPDAVVMGQDFAGSENSAFAAQFVARGRPVVVLPFAMGTTKEINESLYASDDHAANATLFSRWVAKRYPKWLNIYRGRLLLRQPPAHVFASELAGLPVGSPWTPLSGAGKVFLPSQQSYDYYSGAGLPPTRLVVTGSLNDKYWAANEDQRPKNTVSVDWFQRLRRLNSLRNEVDSTVRGILSDVLLSDGISSKDNQQQMRRLRFFLGDRFESESFNERMWGISHHVRPQIEKAAPRSERLVIVSWPTNQFSRSAPALEFEDYTTLSHAWAKALRDAAREEGWTVGVSLHPTLDPSTLSYLENEYGFLVWHGRLIEVIGLADLFVASVSSTLLWASNLMVPAVNFDCYHYGYTEFSDAGSISTVTSYSAFEMELRRMMTDENYRLSWRARAKERRHYWGCFDGDSERRILDAFDQSCLRVSPEM